MPAASALPTASRRARPRARLPRATAFWLLTTTLAFLLFASSAPSPMYVVWEAKWHFSAITLTCVFAIYTIALLVSLLWAGSISDRVGRRPVIVGSLLVEAAAMVVFARAGGVAALVAARIVQGLATGVATGALSAALIDLQPPSRPHLGALLSAAAPPLGLAAGALGSGLLVQVGPDPLGLVFWLLVAVFVLAAAAVLAMPETVPQRGRWAPVLLPRVGVPAAARPMFAAAAPCLIATWALGGLYLSLGPSLSATLLHTTSHVVGGLVIVALTATGAVASIVARHHRAERAMVTGAVMLVVGVAITLAGLNAHATALFFLGSVVAGVGFGPGFSGGFRLVTALAPPTERAGLIAAIYVVSYLGFSLPAIVAGVAVVHAGLLPTTNAYGAFVVLLAAGATALTVARERRAPVPLPEAA